MVAICSIKAATQCHAGMQVVAFQAMMEMMAQQFPGAFSGYNLAVTESHQRTKADTSGTAKAVVGSLQRLGLEFSEVRSQMYVLAHVCTRIAILRSVAETCFPT